jgi:hypothetical protein
MPVSELNFKGINRAVSDYSSDGSCEELTNLRPTTGGLVPVKPFGRMMETVYDKIYEHRVSDGTNYLAVRYANGTLSCHQIDDEGQAIGAALFIIEDPHIISMKYSFAAVSNLALFSCIVEAYPRNLSQNITLRWTGDGYVKMDSWMPAISASFSVDDSYLGNFKVPNFTQSTPMTEIQDIIATGYNGLQEKYKDYCFGQAVIAIALKTADGKTFWTGQWIPINPIPVYKDSFGPLSSAHYFVDETWSGAQYFPDFERDFPDGGYYIARGTASNSYVYGAALKIRMTLGRVYGWSEDTSIVRSAEIYVSRPQFVADISKKGGQISSVGDVVAPELTPDLIDLGGQLLYHQKSIPMKDLVLADQSFILHFGGNIQTTSETLRVDSGAVAHFGEVLAYNSRFHIYGGIRREWLSKPNFSGIYPGSGNACKIFLIYNDGERNVPVYVGTGIHHTDGLILIAPSIRVREVWVTFAIQGGTATYYNLYKYAMTDSARYNYTINTEGAYYAEAPSSPSDEYTELETLAEDGAKSFVEVAEPSAINVSEQYNPFVFDVNHSYLAPGKILDILPQMVAVRDVSFGDYPLDIFTDRGVYALLQGTGTVLYGAFRPISNLVAQSNGVATENGTFFLAAGGLWLVAGGNSVLVSDALSLGPHKYIRNCTGYIAICRGHYDTSGTESQVSFEDFAAGASLSYNRFRDELIISNPTYSYSYVLSLKYRQWFKIPVALTQDSVGDHIASDPVITTRVWAYKTFQAPFLPEGSVLTLTLAIGEDAYIFSHTVTAEEAAAGTDAIFEQFRLEWQAHIIGSMLQGSVMTFTKEEHQTLGTLYTIRIDIDGHDSAGDCNGTFSYRTTTNNLTFDSESGRVTYDLSDETEGTDIAVHLQSRPFSMGGGQYGHIHRVLQMVRASSGDLTVALYGSDNLQDWALLSYANRSGKKISQIRTGPAARSWRYYTITIGGAVPDDTDFGPTMIDFEPVRRRIG